MERLITVTAPGRLWRCGAVLVFGLFRLGSAHASAAPLDGAWRPARVNDTPQAVMQEYRGGQLKSFDPSTLQRFQLNPLGSWVVIAPEPPWDNTERVLTIYPPPAGAVGVYAQDQKTTLALDDFIRPTHGHGRLAWRVPLTQAASAPILLKIEPSIAAGAPVRFEILPWNEYLQQDAQWLAFAGACFAVMLAMVLMAICSALMLRDVTYAWYAGYVLCYGFIQGIQTGFVFHPLEWQWLSGMGVISGAVAVAMSVAFASLFMMRFCELHRRAPLLRVPVITLAVGMGLLVLMRFSHIDLLVTMAQILLNPLLMIGAVLLLLSAAVAAVRGSRQAWFFLIGWTPLILLTALTSAQNNGALPGFAWLNDVSLVGGAFEALLLSLGLADRALRLRQARDLVQVLADHDALTNALNRRSWTERASTILNTSPPRAVALLFLDLDYFKLLNDCLGHNAGDRALVEVSKALSAELRPSDILGRYGGEEFVALLDGTTEEHAMHVATRLCRRVHRLEIPVNDKFMLSVSIGVAMRREGDDVESLAERADQAMYTAKLSGRNQVCLYGGVRSSSASAASHPRLHVVEKRRRDI